MRKNIYLKEGFYEKLKAKAKQNNMSVSAYIRYSLEKLWEGE